MKAAAAETVLLAGLLALAGYVAWDTGPALGLPDSGWLRWITGFFPGFISVQAILLVAVLVVAYWALQALGHRQLSFWLMAGFAVLPHAVPIWGAQPARVVRALRSASRTDRRANVGPRRRALPRKPGRPCHAAPHHQPAETWSGE